MCCSSSWNYISLSFSWKVPKSRNHYYQFTVSFDNMASTSEGGKPIVLHIGDPVKWNLDQYAQFSNDFTVTRPSLEERQRPEFMKALKEKRWGDFHAIFRPFWNTGGEMGRWDSELIPLIPRSCRIFASAGAGFDWADVDLLADRGMLFPKNRLDES